MKSNLCALPVGTSLTTDHKQRSACLAVWLVRCRSAFEEVFAGIAVMSATAVGSVQCRYACESLKLTYAGLCYAVTDRK